MLPDEVMSQSVSALGPMTSQPEEPTHKEASEPTPHELHLPGGPVQVEEFLSVKEAAKLLGVSTRSVYEYIEAGKLLGIRIGSSLAVHAQAVRTYQRPIVGRPRTRIPIWRKPVIGNCEYLTTISVRIRDGQSAKLEQRLEQMRVGKKHLIPGTVARYIVRDQVNPDEIQIVLVWRELVMPPEQERETAIAALRADFADVLAWETAVSREGQVLMNT